jgi:hypothetical protein
MILWLFKEALSVANGRTIMNKKIRRMQTGVVMAISPFAWGNCRRPQSG